MYKCINDAFFPLQSRNLLKSLQGTSIHSKLIQRQLTHSKCSEQSFSFSGKKNPTFIHLDINWVFFFFFKANTIPLLEHEPVQMLTLNYEVFRVCFRWIHVKGSDLSGYPASTKMPLKASLSYTLHSMSHFTAKPLKLIKKILSGLTQLAWVKSWPVPVCRQGQADP